MPTVTGPIPVAVTGLVVIPAAGLLAVAALVAVIVLELPALAPSWPCWSWSRAAPHPAMFIVPSRACRWPAP